MSQCKCDLRTKLVGDGCRYCNPQEYIDNLIESLEEQRTWVGLTDDEIKNACNQHTNWFAIALDLEAKLRSKNGY